MIPLGNDFLTCFEEAICGIFEGFIHKFPDRQAVVLKVLVLIGDPGSNMRAVEFGVYFQSK